MPEYRPVLCVVAGPNGSGKTSTTEKLLANEWTAKAEGFFIRFFYVCTDNPEINILRIAQRYLNGGHEVPISKIISRYYKSLTLAAQAISVVDRAYVYDNSQTDALPQLLFRTVEGKVYKRYTDDVALWAQSLMPR